ncbi:helix-turn-helix transcriptional regulator [Listeria booriae]|uniref:helix-turn-helix transcriptional regulator n=1 Tax=Listeria booriae TaxID=1552123 RepID=UPI0016248B58|nr:YafY family protein [Listeria booriae]MBC2148356.1 YafY family transcriptional regulator [Listeria booriae]MBC2164783.1 YafY family transcriptional regulator [Listeria booriae]MBC2169824.1 YafY family transcriptional regulator [Listeria booriae]
MKIERLISMIMLLLQRELVSAAEMARMFEVSKRTIYRDVDTLSMANIPVYTLPGAKGGIGIMPTYKIDKKLLTVEDLSAIVASLDGLEQLLASPEIKKTVLKMKNMLGENDVLPANSISLDFSNWSMKQELNEKVEKLHLAIKKLQLVQLSYIDRDGKQTTRLIEPYHLLFRNRSWYVQGYSLERENFRTFKISRIVGMDVLDQVFESRNFTVKPFESMPSRPHFQLCEVDLLVDKVAREQIVERFDVASMKQVDEEQFSVVVNLPNQEVGYRFLLQLGTHVTICSRDSFYTGFQAYLRAIHEKYV